jgi:hypothetical protein
MSDTTSETIFSPGMRVRIRDAEWFIKHVAPVKTGGQALYVRGITCPVQGRDQIFWTVVYKAPFFCKDREADYKEAWDLLERRKRC